MNDLPRFTRNAKGWRAFERSDMIGSAMESFARTIASDANRQGSSDYRARQVPDRGGRNNQRRAAAEVYTDNSTSSDARDRLLIRTSYAYRERG